ncbi:unnamed protein product, partial [Prorocentrum cordatum]
APVAALHGQVWDCPVVEKYALQPQPAKKVDFIFRAEAPALMPAQLVKATGIVCTCGAAAFTSPGAVVAGFSVMFLSSFFLCLFAVSLRRLGLRRLAAMYMQLQLQGASLLACFLTLGT